MSGVIGSTPKPGRKSTTLANLRQASNPALSLPKMQKFDFHDIISRMKCGSSALKNFNSLKDSARIWIGMFESLLVAVGGDLDIHGPTVLAQFLVGDDSTW
jgi:hypothetical protein